jgi:protein-S-isoprenylcysteine O-methyltransferase Ste14
MPKLAAGVVINVAIFAALLFLPTRNLDWWRAWMLLGVIFVGAVASTVSLHRTSPALLEERFKSPVQKGQPRADKIVVSLLLALFVASMAFAPIDVFRLHLLPKPGPVTSAAGLVLLIVGWWIMTLALQANPFAAPAVKHQEERHQVAVDRGLYSLVRHPMYAGAVLFFVGMPLWLESYAATVLALVLVVVMVVRIHVEERFLRRELPGYDAYTRRVRYRLIPFVW